jgi:hypothetical protein
MKPRLLALTALVVSLLPSASRAEIKPDSVLLVHSGPPFMSKAATALGAKVVPAVEPITREQLAHATALLVAGPAQPFSDAARAAIQEFVEHGGSLLVIVDDDRRQPRAREIANPLLAPFGLEFTAEIPYVHNVGAVALAGPINREKRELPYSGGRAVKGGTAFSLIQDTDQLAHAAFVERPSGGRVIAIGEAMVALGMGKPEGVRLSGVPNDPSRTTYWGKDSAVFVDEILRWLLASR